MDDNRLIFIRIDDLFLILLSTRECRSLLFLRREFVADNHSSLAKDMQRLAEKC